MSSRNSNSYVSSKSFVGFLSILAASLITLLFNACRPDDQDFVPLKLKMGINCDGVVVPGDTFLITGEGFGSLTSTYVGFGADPGEKNSEINIIEVTNNYVKLVIPQNVKPGKVYVRIFDELDSSECELRLMPVVISSVAPAEAYVGDTITINGEGFSSIKEQNRVNFGGADGSEEIINTLISATNTELRVVVPGKGKSGKITLKEGVFENFKILKGEITTVSTLEGREGTEVTVEGKGFDLAEYSSPEAILKFGNQQFSSKGSFTSLSSRRIKFKIPPGAVSGAIKVYGGAFGYYEYSTPFKVLPSIYYINPVKTSAGETITITGATLARRADRNFIHFNGSATGVNPSEVRFTSLEDDGDGLFYLDVTVPEGLPEDSVSIQIKVPITGAETNTRKIFLTKSTAPKITRISSTRSPVGFELEISGKNFGANPEVKFGTLTAENIETQGDTLIWATVPSGITADVKIEVKNNEGSDLSNETFEVWNQALSIIKITNTGGARIREALKNDIIQIHGTGFNLAGELAIFINGNIVMEGITVKNGNRIDFKIPDYVVGMSNISIQINDGVTVPKISNEIKLSIKE